MICKELPWSDPLMYMYRPKQLSGKFGEFKKKASGMLAERLIFIVLMSLKKKFLTEGTYGQYNGD